jgi:hypothetical protein
MSKEQLFKTLKKFGLEELYRNEGFDGIALAHFTKGKPTKTQALGLDIYLYAGEDWDYDKGYADEAQLPKLREITDEVLKIRGEERRKRREFPPKDFGPA